MPTVIWRWWVMRICWWPPTGRKIWRLPLPLLRRNAWWPKIPRIRRITGWIPPGVWQPVTYHDDSTAVLEVGDEDPLGEGVYFRLQGEPAVYLVDQEFADTVFQDPVYYISTTLISAPSVRDDDTGGEAILPGYEAHRFPAGGAAPVFPPDHHQ